MKAYLLELAPELISHIAASFEKTSDLKSLSCVCKEVNDAVKPLLFSSIQVDTSVTEGYIMKRKMSALECLASSSAIASHVRTVKIGTLAPEYLPAPPPVRHSRNAVKDKDVDEDTIRECARKFEKYFRPALESLQNVQHVQWYPNSKDLLWTHDIIVDCFGHMGLLSGLTIDFTSCPGLIKLTQDGASPIQRLTCQGLTEISLTFDIDNEAQANTLASFLARNITRNLRRLNLQPTVLSRYRNEAVKFNLLVRQDLSPESTVVQVPLKALVLPSLTIEQMPRKIDLRALTMLDIRSSSDQGWRGLQAAHVRLRHLRVEQASEALFSYLESDSYNSSEDGGLEILQFELRARRRQTSPRTRSGPVLQEPSPESLDERLLASYFYESVLPKHENTLKEVKIDVPDVETGWALEISNAGVFSGCARLESLDVCFNSAELHPGEPSDIVATLLQFAVSHPTLTELAIHGVATPWSGWWHRTYPEDILDHGRDPQSYSCSAFC